MITKFCTQTHLECAYSSIFTACSLWKEKNRGSFLDKIHASFKAVLYVKKQTKPWLQGYWYHLIQRAGENNFTKNIDFLLRRTS